MSQLLSKTILRDRTLWFDGDSTYSAHAISKAVTSDSTPFVDELNADIRQYNNLVSADKQVRVKTENRPFKFDWIIPDEFKGIDLIEYLTQKLNEEGKRSNLDSKDLLLRTVRTSQELALYEKHGLNDVLRVLIFVINTLTNQGVVWGVGRGSSVSSYVLYLLQVHDVDSVKYELSITDFLH